jgi:hypothetical protein
MLKMLSTCTVLTFAVLPSVAAPGFLGQRRYP